MGSGLDMFGRRLVFYDVLPWKRCINTTECSYVPHGILD